MGNSPFVHRKQTRRVPLWLKLAYSLFMCVMVPLYLREYGPTNFLYFCDVAAFLTVAAIWLESPLLASMPAVGILLPQTFWMLDFIAACAGFPLTGMTAYMFDEQIPFFTRALSLYHFWLPILVLWLVWRLRYDHRAFVAWTCLALIVLLTCYFFTPPPPAPADNPELPVNINYVYGLGAEHPQKWMPPLVYFGLLLLLLPLVVFLPTHMLLRKVFSSRDATNSSAVV